MRRGTDALGLLLLAGLVALALAGGAALMDYGHFTPWGLALGLFIVVAFVAVGLPSHGTPAPKNSKVHGAAAPAAEQDALAAARGETKTARLHNQQFPE
jgi:hypothetical protein